MKDLNKSIEVIKKYSQRGKTIPITKEFILGYMEDAENVCKALEKQRQKTLWRNESDDV